MTDLSAELGLDRRPIRDAVLQHGMFSRAGLSERLFALLFSGLVYPQIWEDPELDMEALAIQPGERIVTIASGGCNALAYLTKAPGRVDVVDLNAAHVALNRLKLAALVTLPAHADFFRFFGGTGNRANEVAYDRFIAPVLDPVSRRYWEARTWRGSRRIAVFGRDFYRTGLLGRFIAAGHAVARLHGVDPAGIMQAATQADQRRFFEERLAPLFSKPLIRWATSQQASLFGLGIPPAQYEALITDGDGTMASVLAARLEKLCCDFPLTDNYFAWQAFARRYPRPGEAALPPYLDRSNFDDIRAGAERVAVRRGSYTDHLATLPDRSVDCYVLLDAQDWMSDAQLGALWTEITRTATQGARVIFRTAAAPSVLDGRLAPDLAARWTCHAERSRDLGARDRSAIYGGFHLYERH